ncbi:hypothetical protein niasHT_010097 [Heterodera trifolii]|uniref:Uncharacterized protein n=1 Tax=Heterodera trifolii TaxID=157864 RepID=A0ABD2LW85_9BILA
MGAAKVTKVGLVGGVCFEAIAPRGSDGIWPLGSEERNWAVIGVCKKQDGRTDVLNHFAPEDAAAAVEVTRRQGDKTEEAEGGQIGIGRDGMWDGWDIG